MKRKIEHVDGSGGYGSTMTSVVEILRKSGALRVIMPWKRLANAAIKISATGRLGIFAACGSPQKAGPTSTNVIGHKHSPSLNFCGRLIRDADRHADDGTIRSRTTDVSTTQAT